MGHLGSVGYAGMTHLRNICPHVGGMFSVAKGKGERGDTIEYLRLEKSQKQVECENLNFISNVRDSLVC